MRKTAIAIAAAATIGVTSLAASTPAEAHWRGGWGGGGWGPGIAGGLVAGALIGGLASSAYAYGPGYGYYGAPYGYYRGGYPVYVGYAPAYRSYAYYGPRYHRVIRPAYGYYGTRGFYGPRVYRGHRYRW